MTTSLFDFSSSSWLIHRVISRVLGNCTKKSDPTRESGQKTIQGCCRDNCGQIHFLLYLKLLYCHLLILVVQPLVLRSPQEGWAFQPMLILQKFIHLKASIDICISGVQLAQTMSPLFWGCEVPNLGNMICHIRLKSPVLVVDIVQSDH